MSNESIRAHDVFISYSKRDRKIAETVCALLEQQGIRCWIDYRDIPGGVSWPAQIVDAIEGAKVLVMIFSSESNASDQVFREVTNALESGITVIPVRISEVEPSKQLRFYLKGIHWMDAITEPIEGHIKTLASRIKGLVCEKPIIGSPSPLPSPLAPTPPASRTVWAGVIVLVAGMLAGMVWWFMQPSAARGDPTSANTPSQPGITTPVHSAIAITQFNEESFRELMKQAHEKYMGRNIVETDTLLIHLIEMGEAYARENPKSQSRWVRFVAEPWGLRASNSGWNDGNWEDARDYFQNAVNAARMAGTAGLEALSNALRGLAIAESKLGNETDFENQIKESLDVAKKVSFTHVVETYSYWASRMGETNKPEQAIMKYQTALNILDDQLKISPDDGWAKQRRSEINDALSRLTTTSSHTSGQ